MATMRAKLMMEHTQGSAAPGSKVDFNTMKAPIGYVPGLGRGEIGCLDYA